MEKCVFCKIVNGGFNTNFLYEDDSFVAFNDLNPQAPIHILVIPKNHIESVSSADDRDAILVANLLIAAKKVCKELSIPDYRLVINNGTSAGQEVLHLHIHILAGRKFTWPPG